jgi:hypothetical protein
MWQKTMMPLVEGLCLTADFDPHCGLRPNVAQNLPLIEGLWHTVDFDRMWPKMFPFIGGLCHAANFDQMWPKMCPSLEDFVMQRTLTKCGPKCVPCWRTFHAADFDQMWSEMCPLSEDFVTQRTLSKCGPKLRLLAGDYVLLWGLTTYGSTMYSSSKKLAPNKRILISNQHRIKTAVSNYKYHVINMLKGIHANKL